MKNLSGILLAMMLPAFLFVACSKDDDDKKKTEEITYHQPSITSRGEAITVPAGLSEKANTDPGAAIAVGTMGFANAINSFAGNFIVPEGAEAQNLKNGSVVYHWAGSGYGYWMSYSESLTNYTWEYEFETPEFTRFTFMEAQELKTGKAGSWVINDPNTSGHEKIWDYVWSLNNSDDFNATLNWIDGSDLNVFTIISKADNSGSFTLHKNTVKTLEVIWNADGSGSWSYTEGSETLSGSWTA